MRHEIFHQNEGIPSGYDTYSVLLIPRESDFGSESMDLLFAQFKRFGEMIGPDHLACWFYHHYGKFKKGVELDLVGALPVEVFGHEPAEYVRKLGHVGQDREITVNYDVPRARLICTALGLPYDRGPYIPFFTKPPQLPHYQRDTGGVIRSRETIDKAGANFTSPACVLSFGGIRFDRALSLLDGLEQQLIRSKVNVTKLKFNQFLVRLREWFHDHGETVVEILNGILCRPVSAKE